MRYDRTTYQFSATALAEAAAGTAALVANGGKIRVICDWSTDKYTLDAIRAGEESAEMLIGHSIAREEFFPNYLEGTRRDHLELATWLVAHGFMEVRIAIHEQQIFHNKSGIVEDDQGNKVAFAGSLNETLSGWKYNWESVHVYTEGDTPAHLQATETEFLKIWDNKAQGLNVINLPNFFKDYIVQHTANKEPKLLRRDEPAPAPNPDADAYWRRIRQTLADDPDSTVATIPITLWPHQEKFRQMHAGMPMIRKLIADEVGLGKTLQAGIILKTRLNQGMANRVLIIAPKAAAKQWQSELLMKFAIDAPIIDSHEQRWRNGITEPVGENPWDAPLAIVSQQWLVRNQREFLAAGSEYDIIISDEAHRARFISVDSENRRTPTQYLKLLQQLCRKTRDLLLLTATPMQLNELELWALLELLEPEGWNAAQYRQFYAEAEPDLQDWKMRRHLWQQANPNADAGWINSPNDNYVASQLKNPDLLQQSLETMEKGAPAKRLMSRHTRRLLRQYHEQGLLDAPVPARRACDIVIDMDPETRAIYDQIPYLVQSTYAGRGLTKQATGFVNTVYRKRFGSSLVAFAKTLRNAANRQAPEYDDEWHAMLDDIDQEEGSAESMLQAPGDTRLLLKAAEAAEQLARNDAKLNRLYDELQRLRQAGHSHVLIFTQFYDTLQWLAARLEAKAEYVDVLHGGDQRLGSRDERLRKFRQQQEGLLICTETASESLNLQFCSAVINYDIPWNPMTLEQRAGRVDRIGQAKPVVEVINLFYRDTAEHDAYDAVARRMADITEHVGEYPPIIAAAVQRIIKDEKNADAELNRIIGQNTFDLNRLNAEWEAAPAEPTPKISMADFEKPLRQHALMPAGWSVKHAGGKHWVITQPDGTSATYTTDAEAYQDADGRLQWWQGPISYGAFADSTDPSVTADRSTVGFGRVV